jgi:hypothetical protein
MHQSQLNVSEELDLQGIAIRKRILSEERMDTLSGMVRSALTFYLQTRQKEALELLAQTLKKANRLSTNLPN